MVQTKWGIFNLAIPFLLLFFVLFGDEFSLILKHALAASITVQKYNLDGETVTSLSINIKKSRGEAIYITKGTRSREFNYHKSGWLKSFNLRTKSSYSGGMRDVAEFFPKKRDRIKRVQFVAGSSEAEVDSVRHRHPYLLCCQHLRRLTTWPVL